MPADLEQRLRAASPPLPEPGAEATARARAAVLGRSRTRGVGPARWGGSRTARLLITAALLTAAGGAVAATLLQETSSAPAPAPLRWGPAELLSPRFGSFVVPAVAIAGNGDVLVAWLQGARLDVRLRAADSRWAAPSPLSTPGAVASGPAAALDARGNAVIVWRERRAARIVTLRLRLSSGAPAGAPRARADETFVVVARRRVIGGEWGPIEELSQSSGNSRDGAEPQLALARDGAAIAAWPHGSWIEVRSRSAGGTWSAIARLDAGGVPQELRLALDPSGAAALVWTTRRQGPARAANAPQQVYVVRAALRPASGAWQTPADLSGPLPNAPGRARIAVDRRLLAAAVWTRWAPPGQRSDAEVAVHRPSGGWTASRALDPDAPLPGPDTSSDPRATVGIDAEGTIVAVFARAHGVGFTTLSSDGSPAPAQALGGGLARWAAFDPDGAGGLALVLGTRRGLEFRFWRPGAAWTQARAIPGSARAQAPAFSARRGIGAILAWVQSRGTGSTPLQLRAALARPEAQPRRG